MSVAGIFSAVPSRPNTGAATDPRILAMAHNATVLLLLAPTLLGGCGLGETAATAAAGGASRAQEAAQARRVLNSVQQQMDLGAQQAEDRLRAAEAARQ